MLLLRGATRSVHDSGSSMPGFNTCSSCEEQLIFLTLCFCKTGFQYMLLLRGATQYTCRLPYRFRVSIHAPLARSNSLKLFPSRMVRSFNTCSSCEEQLDYLVEDAVIVKVSIHAPLARSNNVLDSMSCRLKRFQYMLLLRGATRLSILNSRRYKFQYMLLLRGATLSPVRYNP